MPSDSGRPLNIAVFVSGQGRGTNLQAILDGCTSGNVPADVGLVVGTRSDAPAMERAHAADVQGVVVSPKKYEGNDAAYGETLLRVLERAETGLICLAGYMRILPPAVVEAYRDRIMNVHPALLPFFGGKGMFGEHVHRAVIDSGMKVSGCTVHFVDEHYDNGPIILQRTVPVLFEDTPQTLAARILPEEHRAYAEAIRLFAEGRLEVVGRRVRVRDDGPSGG